MSSKNYHILLTLCYVFAWLLPLVHELAGEIEPKPGVPPSARHLTSIGRGFKDKGVKAILQEPFYNAKAAQRVAQSCGAKVVIRANCTGGADGIDDYVAMLDSVLTGLKDALEAR
ncbi:MAG: hypothetical protein IJS15_03415 [Victivallales bacterium]|nr:hypothetical protein [Victivallales bacterium]